MSKITRCNDHECDHNNRGLCMAFDVVIGDNHECKEFKTHYMIH